MADVGGDIKDERMNRQALGHVEADEMAGLRNDDENADARREAHDYRMRYEIDERAEPQGSEPQLHQPHHEGKRYGKLHVMGGARFGESGERGGKHKGRCGTGTRDQMPRGAKQRGDNGRHDGGVQPILGRHAGDRREGDALRQHDNGARQSREEIRG